MKPNSAWIVTVIATVILAGFIILAIALGQSSTSGFSNAAAVLTIVGLASIGIERLIEGIWTVVGLTAGSWWPMGTLSKELLDKVESLDGSLQPFFKQVNAALSKVTAGTGNWTDATIKEAEKDLQSFQDSIAKLKALPNDDQRAQVIVTAVQNGLNTLNTKYHFTDGGLENIVHVTKAATDDITAFVATFKDNPGKRLISIYVGIILGLLASGLLGLNLLSAALTTAQLKGLPSYIVSFGIVLAGITMGLGSAPAHEIIQAIQEFKQSTQGTNLAISGAAVRTSSMELMKAVSSPSPAVDERPILSIPRQ